MSQDTDREARIFPVDTRFQRMARRPGGVSRTQAVKNAEATIEKCKPEFDLWLDAQLQALVEEVRNAKMDAADGLQWRNSVGMRSRQLRDLGTTMGFPLLSFVADNLCEIIDRPRAGVDCNIELITCHVDALLLARQAQYRTLRPEQLPELSRGLLQVAESARAVPAERPK